MSVGFIIRAILTVVFLAFGWKAIRQGDDAGGWVLLSATALWVSGGRSEHDDAPVSPKAARDRDMLARWTGQIQPSEWPKQPPRTMEESE